METVHSAAVHRPTKPRRKALSRSELLQETQHQVSQRGAQRLVVVADDVRPVLLQLDQRVLLLQVQDVSVCCLLHLHLRDAVLQTDR